MKRPTSFLDVVQNLPPPPTSIPRMRERGEFVERKVAPVGLVQFDAFAGVQIIHRGDVARADTHPGDVVHRAVDQRQETSPLVVFQPDQASPAALYAVQNWPFALHDVVEVVVGRVPRATRGRHGGDSPALGAGVACCICGGPTASLTDASLRDGAGSGL